MLARVTLSAGSCKLILIFLAIYEMNKVQIQVTESKKKNNPFPSGVLHLLNRMVLCPVHADSAAREMNVPVDMMPM